MDSDLIPAVEACRLLGISPATLYAYVSRGLLESRPGRDHRSRVYLRREVEQLAQRKRLGRGPARGAAQSLDRGLPVLETRISLIRPDGPYYRGRSAVAAVRAGATLEDTARLLWDCGSQDPFVEPPGDWPARVAALALDAELPPLARAMAVIPLLALQVPHSFRADQATRRAVAATLLRQNAALLVASRPAGPVHRLLGQTWRPGDAAFAELVRAALVLCADHELNVSAFAARVVASTGAHLHATVCAGLSALSGPRHGGAATRAYMLIEQAGQSRDIGRFIATHWRQGEDLPGFGHALYPDGDPRAAELLSMLRAAPVDPATMRLLDTVIDAAGQASGRQPNIDFMLTAICLAFGLPATHALAMFATSRLAGWLAHALEQQAQGRLIRPRARYTGLQPEAAAAAAHD
ncbi:citrate synthase [Pseudoxanthomonas broegbernensis]|uniref:citrate synthase (unknown stereospecificity) n=1 Tax=Pseudoxanthomonas broegbernensis TaxID=83619 RepID=A0A7V8GKZ7_9GAMM|nr:citrate synthase family protein [Pseudoxanthomonas broegbernensis]KAF1685479.1 citrate synthase [Pseudoxanthomonas broegbernensis]MBB6064385.1 citrate synthase [Pseudoxanthomonas broegbernensis]